MRSTELLREIIRFKIYYPLRSLGARLRDHYHGVDTEAGITLRTLGYSNVLGTDYEATPYRDFLKIMRSLDVQSGDVFLDIGSGKGRTLLLALKLPFKRIVGVDISEEINSICRHNLARAVRRGNAPTIEVVTAEATTYIIPDDVTHVYFFNPLPLPAMDQVLSNIAASFTRQPRKILILYYNPRHAQELEEQHSLVKVAEIESQHFSLFRSRCNVYLFTGHIPQKDAAAIL